MGEEKKSRDGEEDDEFDIPRHPILRTFGLALDPSISHPHLIHIPWRLLLLLLLLSFGVGGWLQFYQFGVARALQQARMHENAAFIGTSSGGFYIILILIHIFSFFFLRLTATGLALDGPFEEAVEYCKEFLPHSCVVLTSFFILVMLLF